jgi:hypothetical protein
LRGKLVTGQLLFDGPVIVVPLHGGVLVAIQGQRDSVCLHHGAQQAQVSSSVFPLGLEVRRGHFTRGVVDQTQQRQPGSTLLQSSVPAAVDQQQHAFLLAAGTPGAVARRPALLRRA